MQHTISKSQLEQKNKIEEDLNEYEGSKCKKDVQLVMMEKFNIENPLFDSFNILKKMRDKNPDKMIN